MVKSNAHSMKLGSGGPVKVSCRIGSQVWLSSVCAGTVGRLNLGKSLRFVGALQLCTGSVQNTAVRLVCMF
jgi:hypothetical protein